MTAAQVISLLTAVAGVIGAVVALLKQVQQGKQVADHAQRISTLEGPAGPPPYKP